MIHLTLIRTFNDGCRQTRGVFLVLDDQRLLYSCFSLELPDKNNQKEVSRIPPGLYWCKKRYSLKFKNHFWLTDVPNREMILIHTLNTIKQTRGCIGVGEYFANIDDDDLLDVANSRKALDKILSLCPDAVQLEIIDSHKLQANPCV